MKKMMILVLALVATTTMATTPIDPSNPGFQPCTDNDWNLLTAATVRGSRTINNLVTENVIPTSVSCIVEKPRFFHPAVCGAHITQVDTFIINTEEKESFTIQVDSSYSSCVRMRVIPMIKSLEYTPIADIIRFP